MLRGEEFVIDIGLDAEELPNLPILERDLQNVIVFLVGERLDFGIEDFNGRYVQRRHKVRTILHLCSLRSLQNTISAKTSVFSFPNKCMV